MESSPFKEYFDAYENIVYYSSFRRQGQRYQYRPKLIGYIKACIDILDNEHNRKLIKTHVFSKLRRNFAEGSNTLERLIEENEECVTYLGLTSSSDIKDLKNKYRRACMKYHPDRGGDEETLKIINSCYPTFFQIVAEAPTGDQIETSNQIDWIKLYTVNDFCCVMQIKLLQLLVEEDDIVGAKAQLEVIESSGTLEAKTFKTSRFMFYDSYLDNPLHKAFYECLTRLAGRLILLGEMRYAQNLLDSHIADMEYRLRYLSSDRLKDNRDTLGEKIEGKKKQIIVVKRQRQAQNLYDQGIIDLARYKKAISRLESQEAASEVSRKYFENWLSLHNFSHLSDIKKYQYNGQIDVAVPYPQVWETCLEQLSPRQVSEYINTFYHSPTYDLVSKYLEVRVSSIIYQLYDVPSSDYLAMLSREAEFFRDVMIDQEWLAKSLSTFVELLVDKQNNEKKSILGGKTITKNIIRNCGPSKYLEIALNNAEMRGDLNNDYTYNTIAD